MRLLIALIDWEYPRAQEAIQPTVWDLQDQNTLLSLVLAYGNGIILELRAEGENAEALEALRGIVAGAGNSHAVELSLEAQQRLWLYRAGDECYRQAMHSGGYTFINPKPQPHKFSTRI